MRLIVITSSLLTPITILGIFFEVLAWSRQFENLDKFVGAYRFVLKDKFLEVRNHSRYELNLVQPQHVTNANPC